MTSYENSGKVVRKPSRWESTHFPGEDTTSSINFRRLVRNITELIEVNIETLNTLKKEQCNNKRTRDGIDDNDASEQHCKDMVKESCKKKRKVVTKLRKNHVHVALKPSCQPTMVEVSEKNLVAPRGTQVNLDISARRESSLDGSAYPLDKARIGAEDADLSLPDLFTVGSVDIIPAEKIAASLAPVEQELTGGDEKKSPIKNEIEKLSPDHFPGNVDEMGEIIYPETTSTTTIKDVNENCKEGTYVSSSAVTEPLYVTQSTPLRETVMARLQGLKRRDNFDPVDLMANYILHLPRPSEDFAVIRRVMAVLPQNTLPTSEIKGLEKHMASNISNARTRVDDERDLREPEDGERPCVNGKHCQGMTIPGAIPVILKEVCSRSEIEIFKETGVWPETPRTCVMCERYYVESAYWNLRGSGEAVRANGINNIQRWSNLVDIKGEYSSTDMIMSLPHAHMGIFAPSIAHKRNAYKQIRGPTGKMCFTQPGYIKPLKDGPVVFRRRSQPSATETSRKPFQSGAMKFE